MVRIGRLGLIGTLLWALSPTFVSAAEPEITIYLKGGVGTIRAERTWEQGSHLCYESRGFRNYIPKDRVSSAPVTTPSGNRQNAQTSPRILNINFDCEPKLSTWPFLVLVPTELSGVALSPGTRPRTKQGSRQPSNGL